MKHLCFTCFSRVPRFPCPVCGRVRRRMVRSQKLRKWWNQYQLWFLALAFAVGVCVLGTLGRWAWDRQEALQTQALQEFYRGHVPGGE